MTKRLSPSCPAGPTLRSADLMAPIPHQSADERAGSWLAYAAPRPAPDRLRCVDPKRLVAEGYDRIHLTYAGWGDQDGLRSRYVDEVIARGLLTRGGVALDLGCGTGALGTAAVDELFTVVGVDISEQSVRTARSQLPSVQYVVADMANLGFASMSFDLVTAFYSLIHVPRGASTPLCSPESPAVSDRPGSLC